MKKIIFPFMLLGLFFTGVPELSGAEDEARNLTSPKVPQNPPRVITLAEAQKSAARNNPSIQNIDEVIKRADISIQSAWSMLLPNLRAHGSIVRNQQEVAVGFPDFSTFDPTNPKGSIGIEEVVIQELWGQSAGFSANMALFNPRSLPAIKMAYELREQTYLNAQVEKNELLFAVTSAYFQLHTLREMIAVNQDNLKIAEQFFKLSEAQNKVGQGTKIDIKRAELQVGDAKKAVANAEDAYAIGKKTLAYLIGAEGDFDITGPVQISEVNKSESELVKTAMQNRLELQAAERAQAISERSELESWMKWLPAFDVTYSWSWNSAAGFAGDNATWMIIFGAEWNLFEGGSRIAELKTRKSMTRSAINTIKQLKLDIRREVEQSALEVNKRKRNVEFAEQQLSLAEENHRLVSRQYEVGMATSLDVMSASIELATKRRTRVLERLAFDIAVLTLRKAIGQYHSLSRLTLD